MHMGQVVQSHSMHFFELAGPDLLLGFDAAPAKRNVVGLIESTPAWRSRVLLRKYGQSVISAPGRKRGTQSSPWPAGSTKRLRPLPGTPLADLEARIADVQDGIDRQGLAAGTPGLRRELASFLCGYMGLVGTDVSRPYEGQVRLIDCQGT